MNNPFESLLEAAQQIDSPNFNIKVVVEMKQQQTASPTMKISTPRPSVSTSATAATMPPPPPPHQVQLVPAVNNNGLRSMPSLSSPCRARTPAPRSLSFNYYDAAEAAVQSSGPFAPPTAVMAALTMTSNSPSSSWPYYNLSPRFSSGPGTLVVSPAAAVGHISRPVSAQRPLCLFPGAPADVFSSPQARVPQVSRGLVNLGAPTASAIVRPLSTPKSRTGFLETKLSAEDGAPPAATGMLKEEEAPTPTKAATKIRNVVTPNTDTEVINDDDDEECDVISTSATSWPVDENITLPALFDEDDIPFVNPSHYIIGSEILEAFVVPKYHDDDDAPAAATKSKGKAAKKTSAPKKHRRSKKKIDFRAGSVAFRCRFCKNSPYKNGLPLATIYPQSLKGLYRANLRFQANHLKKCKYYPVKLKKRIENAQHNDNRSSPAQGGVRKYWIKTAARKGFRKVIVNGQDMLGFVGQEQEYH